MRSMLKTFEGSVANELDYLDNGIRWVGVKMLK